MVHKFEIQWFNGSQGSDASDAAHGRDASHVTQGGAPLASQLVPWSLPGASLEPPRSLAEAALFVHPPHLKKTLQICVFVAQVAYL